MTPEDEICADIEAWVAYTKDVAARYGVPYDTAVGILSDLTDPTTPGFPALKTLRLYDHLAGNP